MAAPRTDETSIDALHARIAALEAALSAERAAAALDRAAAVAERQRADAPMDAAQIQAKLDSVHHLENQAQVLEEAVNAILAQVLADGSFKDPRYSREWLEARLEELSADTPE